MDQWEMCLCTKYSCSICDSLEQAYIPDADKVLKVADELIQDLKG